MYFYGKINIEDGDDWVDEDEDGGGGGGEDVVVKGPFY